MGLNYRLLPADCEAYPVNVGSYYLEYSGASLSNLCTIATNKNFIITDVVFGNITAPASYASSRPTRVEIRYTKDTHDTILLKTTHIAYLGTGGSEMTRPHVITFRSSLVVPAGAILKAGGFLSTWNDAMSCTISGFEIPVE